MMSFIKKILGLQTYTSELDQFLAQLDKQHSKPSASQCAEIMKYKLIFHRRDHAENYSPAKKLWGNF